MFKAEPVVTSPRVLTDIFKRWKRELGKLPEDYLSFDMETTGFSATDDLIVELGKCSVVGGVAEHYENHILDWTSSKYIDLNWLEWKLDRCKAFMAKAGKPHHITIERMKEEGLPPKQVLGEYVLAFAEARKAGHFVMGHNIIRFDTGRFTQASGEWLGHPWEFDPDELIDTAAIAKAHQFELEFHKGESVNCYLNRVLNRPTSGIQWSMEPHCVETYGLLDNYSLDMSQAHSAGFDSMLVHILFEELKERAMIDEDYQ